MNDEEIDAILERESMVLDTIMKDFGERLASIPGCFMTTYSSIFGNNAVCYRSEAILKLYLREPGNSRRDQMYRDLKKDGPSIWGGPTLNLIDISLLNDMLFIGPTGFSLNDPNTFENAYDCIFNYAHDSIVCFRGRRRKGITPKNIKNIAEYLEKLLAKEHNRIIRIYNTKFNRQLKGFDGA